MELFGKDGCATCALGLFETMWICDSDHNYDEYFETRIGLYETIARVWLSGDGGLLNV